MKNTVILDSIICFAGNTDWVLEQILMYRNWKFCEGVLIKSNEENEISFIYLGNFPSLNYTVVPNILMSTLQICGKSTPNSKIIFN